MNILLIGPASLKIIGGTSVSFRYLCASLNKRDEVRICVTNTTGIRKSKLLAPCALAVLFWRVCVATPRCDVVTFHAMPTALPNGGWFIWIAAAFWHKPIIYRAFGGSYYDELKRRWQRGLAKWLIRRADGVLLQTKELTERAVADGVHRVSWFPTARPMPEKVPIRDGPCRRFVFIGQLKISKGLEYLARAAAKLPDDAYVDVYGPWYNLPRGTFEGRKGIRYVRTLHPEEVVRTLSEYDASVIPTFVPMEGHPGIVVESYAAGIPVIATRWKALPEIIADGVSGILIEPRSEHEIASAMMRLYDDDALYCRLARGSAAMRLRFTQERQTDCFIEICHGALSARVV